MKIYLKKCMKKILILLLGFACYSAKGQIANNKIGHYFDVDGISIGEYYEVDYEPKTSFDYIHNIGAEFSPGYFYTLTGKKTEGFIKYTQNNTDFKFKTSLDDKASTTYSNQCQGFVIGLDSFAVINYNDVVGIKNISSSYLQFAEVIEELGSLSFYKQFNTNSSTTEIFYYVKSDSSKKYWAFPQKKTEFKEMAVKIFGSSVTLSNRIASGKYSYEDLLNVIKLFKYKIAFEMQEKIFFNSSFNEMRDSGLSIYYAKVESTKDSIHRIAYYVNKSNVKLFEGELSSFIPEIKEGEFIYYYPNGVIRKKLLFENNKPIKGLTYFNTGDKHREFSFSSNVENYKYIYDIHGNQILNPSGAGEELFFDSINNREIIYEYSTHKLISAYFVDSHQTKIYQYCQNNVKVKSINEIQKMFNEKTKYPQELISNNTYGIVLLKCQVDPSGKISDVRVVKGVDPNIDKLVQSFVPYLKAYNALEAGKVNKEKVNQEVVIPFEFSLVGFTRTGMYNSKFWMQGGLAVQRALMNTLLR